MRKRNPDEQAYRAWQADPSDRGALQRYLSSMARERKVLDDPERIAEIDEVLEDDEFFREVYEMVRPDYSDEKTRFSESRWRILVDRYIERDNLLRDNFGMEMNPRAVLLLVEMGLRAGVSIRNVYEIMFSKSYYYEHFYRYIYGIMNYREIVDDYLDFYNLSYLPGDGCFYAPAVPALIYLMTTHRNMDDGQNVVGNCVQALGQIGPLARSAIPFLISIMDNVDSNNFLRHDCAEALGLIGLASGDVIEALNRGLSEESWDFEFRVRCASAIESIFKKNHDFANKNGTISALLSSVENDENDSVRAASIRTLSSIGVVDDRIIKTLSCIMDNDDDYESSLGSRIACAQFFGDNKVVTTVNLLIKNIRLNLDEDLTLVCVMAIGKIGPEASPATLTLVECLFNENLRQPVRLRCISSLRKIGSGARDSIPFLMRVLDDENMMEILAFDYDEEEEYNIPRIISRAIEQITGEAPQ